MEGNAYVDPLAGVLPQASKSRFAGMDWPVWDHDIFDAARLEQDFAPEQAFMDGLHHLQRAVGFDRPTELASVLDVKTLNFIGRFGLLGCSITHAELLNTIQGSEDLLTCYYRGVLFGIETLRDKAIPDGVNAQDLTELFDALEAYTHNQYISMTEIGAGVTEEVEAENVLTKFTAFRIVDSASEQGEAGEGESSDVQQARKGKNAVNLGTVYGERVSGGQDEEERVTWMVLAKGKEEVDEGGSAGGEGDVGDKVAELPAGKESDGGLAGEKVEEVEMEAGAGESKPAKRAKSKKAKKAKMLAKKAKKAAMVSEALEEF